MLQILICPGTEDLILVFWLRIRGTVSVLPKPFHSKSKGVPRQAEVGVPGFRLG